MQRAFSAGVPTLMRIHSGRSNRPARDDDSPGKHILEHLLARPTTR